jgi:hypothetical protein
VGGRAPNDADELSRTQAHGRRRPARADRARERGRGHLDRSDRPLVVGARAYSPSRGPGRDAHRRETGFPIGGSQVLEMTNENFARLLRGLTIAVGNRRNRILLYRFLAAEIRALHCSYGVGDGESYKRALTFLENCERYTLRSLVRRSAKHHAEMTVDHAKRIFSRALKKLDTSQGDNPTLRAMIVHLLQQEPLQTGNT